MAAGHEPSEYIPNEEDYKLVEDDHLKKILKFIFERKSNDSDFKHSIDKVLLACADNTSAIRECSMYIGL